MRKSATTATMMKTSNRWLGLLAAAILVSSAIAYTDDGSTVECMPGRPNARLDPTLWEGEEQEKFTEEDTRRLGSLAGSVSATLAFGISTPFVEGSTNFRLLRLSIAGLVPHSCCPSCDFLLSSVLRSRAGAQLHMSDRDSRPVRVPVFFQRLSYPPRPASPLASNEPCLLSVPSVSFFSGIGRIRLLRGRGM